MKPRPQLFLAKAKEVIATQVHSLSRKAAAAAAKAGKKNFNFGGKTHPVTMKKDTATKIADQKEATNSTRLMVHSHQKEKMVRELRKPVIESFINLGQVIFTEKAKLHHL